MQELKVDTHTHTFKIQGNILHCDYYFYILYIQITKYSSRYIRLYQVQNYQVYVLCVFSVKLNFCVSVTLFFFANAYWNDFCEFSEYSQNWLRKVIRKNNFSENVYVSPFSK